MRSQILFRRPGLMRPLPAVLLAAACLLLPVLARAAGSPAGPAHGTIDDGSGDRFSWGLMDPASGTSTMDSHGDEWREIQRALRDEGRPLFWFHLEGTSYVVRDPRIVERADRLAAPIRELGAKQGRLGARQAKLGEQQARIGEKQAEIGLMQARMAGRMAKLSRATSRASAEERREFGQAMRELQEQQAELQREQAPLQQLQSELGRSQGEMGREQSRQSAEVGRQMRALAEEALREGRAVRVSRQRSI